MSEDQRDLRGEKECEAIARDIEYIADGIGISAWNGFAVGAYTLADLKRFQRRLVKLGQDMADVYEQRRGPGQDD